MKNGITIVLAILLMVASWQLYRISEDSREVVLALQAELEECRGTHTWGCLTPHDRKVFARMDSSAGIYIKMDSLRPAVFYNQIWERDDNILMPGESMDIIVPFPDR